MSQLTSRHFALAAALLLALPANAREVSATGPIPFLTISGQALFSAIGYSLSEIGDVNGNGKIDLVVGAPGIGAPGVLDRDGHAYVFCLGGSADSVPCLTLSTGAHFPRFNFGISLASIGDFNGDGQEDLVGGGTLLFGSGAALIYYGGKRSRGTPDLVLGSPLPDSGIPQLFGNSMSGAGDLNGDGFDDVIVGAPWWTEYDYTAHQFSGEVGRAYVFLGSARPDSVADLVLDTPLPRYSGSEYHFGYSVARVGDVNGDGYQDFAVAQEDGPPCYGTAYIYYGGPLLDSVPDRTVKISPFTGGFQPAIVPAGDFNADGYDDFAVRAATEDPTGYSCSSLPGHLYVYFGSSTGPSESDPDLILSGDAPDDIGSSIFGGRDVNGDGYPDIIAGAPGANGYGKVYVFFGGPGADASPDVALIGDVYLGHFGESVSAVDINGDGVSDVVVGAPGYPTTDPGTLRGHVYVYDLSGPLQARAFVRGEHRTIPLVQAPAQLCVRFEPVGSSYDPLNVDLSTIRLVSPGTGMTSEIAPIQSKRVIMDDTDGNGVPELSQCFGRSDFERLFSSVRGRRTVDIALEGRLENGRRFRAPLSLTILGAGKPIGLIASMSPNPLNPQGTLTFSMGVPGSVTVRLYDLNGGVVRTVIAAEQFPAGAHQITVDGRDGRGKMLASGVYFYRVETPERAMTGGFVVLK